MRNIDGTLQLSASDLVGHLHCDHLTALNIQVATGVLPKPDYYDPLLEILRERGLNHEQAFVAHLEGKGLSITRIDGVDITDDAVTATLEAMRAGDPIIVQAALRNSRWSGRADILRRVEKASDLGDWSYEVIDTKLARETKSGTILQLCLYADLLTAAQGVEPEYIHVVSPWSDYEPQTYRVADFAAYFRHVKHTTEGATQGDGHHTQTYPDPKAHCDMCRWSAQCDERRREDDHLCLVANITKNQINELHAHGITTMKALADSPIPLPFQPQRGSISSFEKAQAQAAIQVRAREVGEGLFEFLDVIPGAGFEALPEPSAGDVFFDIESDQFVGEHGLEYLLGYAFKDDNGQMQYHCEWALDRDQEKLAFENFVDFVTARRAQYPDMHVYHFAPYEPAALKRLMGRYATRETEIDNLLRGLVFVDLLAVVRNGIRASVESYSLKKLEPFFDFERQVTLHDANVALTRLSAELELNDEAAIDEDTRATVQGYNADDCLSTAALRDWLEQLRTQRIDQGFDIQRPAPGQEGPSEELSEQAQRVQELVDRLTHDVPIDPDERTDEQQARWILAYLLEWHRREERAIWWEYFRLSDLTADELLHERAALSGLTFLETVETTPRGIPTDRYQFEQQDTDIRGQGENLNQVGGEGMGTAVAISPDDRTVDIKKTGATKDIHPEAVFVHQIIRSTEQAASLFRLGEYVAEHGLEGDGPFRSGRALLLRAVPSFNGELIQEDGEPTLDAALRLTHQLESGVLPIQGPPGAGKSHTGAHMICELVQQGKTVGITANSHKVIRSLLDKVIKVADELNITLHCIQKPKEPEPDTADLSFAKKNEDLFTALANSDAQVAGATHFVWSREEAQGTLDVLVVDEAAQMSLANVLAISPAADTLILLGDPQQLEQPIQGSHPDGTDVSSLEHILGEKQTLGSDQGLFLETTWRLHPDICAFNSELFYESKLEAMPDCVRQEIRSDGPISGHGIRYLPITHTGNTNASIEEAEAVHDLVHRILSDGTTWVSREGEEATITLDDILIIAPYNAQVFEIQQRLPNARVGTVDKFQGQEAPIAIFSMATSSFADAPRGMEFLYSPNRLNVAISRAKCLAILVASPTVFEAECRTPRQMQLANAFCRYLEMAQTITLDARRSR
ncbi:MAG: TM0106 family RecB-like putative nuclease [Oceanospirillales bacterium]|nr:TM0106 family RecB-like putative nuclease [Oceanospirillales bacterium]